MAKSLSYHEHLIDFLSDPKTSAAYLEDIIRDNEGEPRLLSLGLRNIAEALGRSKFSEAELKEYQAKINDILSSQGDDVIYKLEEWLSILGLQLSIAVIEQPKAPLTLNDNSETAMVTLR